MLLNRRSSRISQHGRQDLVACIRWVALAHSDLLGRNIDEAKSGQLSIDKEDRFTRSFCHAALVSALGSLPAHPVLSNAHRLAVIDSLSRAVSAVD